MDELIYSVCNKDAVFYLDIQPYKKRDDVILKTVVEKETEKAILINYNDRLVWLPKSQLKVRKNDDSMTINILIPGWLAEKTNIEGT